MAFEVDTDKKIAIFFEVSNILPTLVKVSHNKNQRRKAECNSEAMLSSPYPMQKIRTILQLIAVLLGF
jgi:hypothetical protein